MRRWVERLRRLERQLPPPVVRVVFVEETAEGQLVVWPTGEPYQPTGAERRVQLEWDDEAFLQAQRAGNETDTTPAG